MPGAQILFLSAGSDSFAYAVWIFICKSQICHCAEPLSENTYSRSYLNNHFHDYVLDREREGKWHLLRLLSFPPLYLAMRQCNFAMWECLYYFKKQRTRERWKMKCEDTNKQTNKQGFFCVTCLFRCEHKKRSVGREQAKICCQQVKTKSWRLSSLNHSLNTRGTGLTWQSSDRRTSRRSLYPKGRRATEH